MSDIVLSYMYISWYLFSAVVSHKIYSGFAANTASVQTRYINTLIRQKVGSNHTAHNNSPHITNSFTVVLVNNDAKPHWTEMKCKLAYTKPRYIFSSIITFKRVIHTTVACS